MEQVSLNKRPPQLDETLSSPKRIKTSEPRGTEELKFCELYEVVMNNILKIRNVTEEDVKLAIVAIIQSFKFKEGNQFSDIDYNVTENVCGYLYRYAPQGAGLVRSRILTAVQKCEDSILEIVLKRPFLNIVSLGGGPGNDVIGFCSALCELYDTWNITEYKLHFTVIDKLKRWASCLSLTDFLLREGTFGRVSKLFQEKYACMKYFEKDVLCENSSGYHKTLAAANVVIITRLMSVLDWDGKRRLIKIVAQNVKSGAIILYIDSPLHTDMWSFFDALYLSEEPDYIMSIQRDRFPFSEISSKAQIAVLRRK